MVPMPRRTRSAVSSQRKKNVAAQKRPVVYKCCNHIKCRHAVKMKTLQSPESRECQAKVETMGCSRAVLEDTTNKSPAARNLMALRTRKNVVYDCGLDSSSSTTSADLSYDLKVIRSPRSNKLNKKCYSMKSVDVCQVPAFKNSFVLLENIDELIEKRTQTSPESNDCKKTVFQNSFVLLENADELIEKKTQTSPAPNDCQKTCVYKNTKNTDENLKPVGDMLPEEKLALYEFEVDENEPKQVKKKRKRQPRIKRPRTYDSEQSALMSVVKQMRYLTTSNTNAETDQNITSTCPSSLTACKSKKTPQDSQILKQSLSKANVANRPILVQKNTNFKTPDSMKIMSISPIEKSGDKQIIYSPKTVRFANNYAPVNSTPHTPDAFRKTEQISTSPNLGTPTFKLKSPRNRGVSSIYIRPNSNVHHKFVLDDSICSENEELTQLSAKTPPNIRALSPVKRQDRSRQTSIQHFFNTSSPTANETNLSNNNTKTNLDASGLFDETSNSRDQVPQSSRNSNLSFPSFVTVRKKYQFNHLNNSSSSSSLFNEDSQRESLQPHKKLHLTFDDRVAVRKKYTYVPRISSFEPRDSPANSGKELVLENYFGFDDSESEDETAAPLQPANCKNEMPASSTPCCSNVQSTQPQPERISVQELKKILAPIVAKKPVYPKPSLQDTRQSLTPTSVQSSVSSIPVNPKSLPVSWDLSQSQSTSPSMLFSEPKILTPVCFADDTPSEYFSKPARKSYGRSTRTKRLHYNEDLTDEHETPEKIPKKKKRDVKTKDSKLDLWAADINSHFNEIEGMELCVE